MFTNNKLFYDRIFVKFLGDCSEQKEIPNKYGWCRFTHSWHPDSADLLDTENLELVHGVEYGFKKTVNFYVFRLLYVLISIVVVVIVITMFVRTQRKQKQN